MDFSYFEKKESKEFVRGSRQHGGVKKKKRFVGRVKPDIRREPRRHAEPRKPRAGKKYVGDAIDVKKVVGEEKIAPKKREGKKRENQHFFKDNPLRLSVMQRDPPR